MDAAEHIRVLREFMKQDHEDYVAKRQEWADRAAAAGDTARQREYLEEIERLEAIPKPWEKPLPDGLAS